MRIQLSDHFNYKKLLRFTLPSIVMMIFTSIYGVVDGFFVSNLWGKTPFTAVNFIMPFLMILGAVGFMFGTGGQRSHCQDLGEGGPRPGQPVVFSFYLYIGGLRCGACISGYPSPPADCLFAGGEGEMLEHCVTYGRIVLLALPAYTLQFEFQSFFVTAERPQLGLAVTVLSGLTNMVLDALLVAVFPLGLQGRQRPQPLASASAASCR